MKAVYALYDDGHAAQEAVNRLRASGLNDNEITILSGQPMEDFEFGQIDSKSHLWRFACLGGALGLGVAIGLAWLAESAWPMQVGALPVFHWWSNLVVMFEMSLLGAIVATVAALLVSASLPGRGEKLYDPAVTQGLILVGVEDPGSGSVDEYEKALGAPMGAVVKKI